MATATHSGQGTHFDRLESLLAKQDALLRIRRQALRQRAAAEMTDVKDAEERSADVEESGVGFALLELNSQMVQEMETTLARMKSGTFGRCSDCRRPIASLRLRAVSFADRCRECQERAERPTKPQSPGGARRHWIEQSGTATAVTRGRLAT